VLEILLGVGTFLMVIGAIVFKAFGLGKRMAQADHFEETIREQNVLREQVNTSQNAGNKARANQPARDPVAPNSGRVLHDPRDPNDRANRKTSR
jgi:hypothetical protein